MASSSPAMPEDNQLWHGSGKAGWLQPNPDRNLMQSLKNTGVSYCIY